MEPYDLRLGDCLEVMRTMADNSVDSVVTDPPYHLASIVKRFGGQNAAPAQFGTDGAFARASAGFMGQQWDGGDIAFRVELWAEVFRVLKPGGYLLAFSATRTYHRMAVAIEDSGFEIRDQIGWTYGSGFPKSHDQGDGRGTALKPAWEPICMARKPLSEGTVAANIARWGTGALNIDVCRVGFAGESDESETKGKNSHAKFGSGPRDNNVYSAINSDRADYDPPGRWPANLIHDGSDEVVRAFPDSITARIEKPSDCSTDGNTSFDNMRGNRPARGYDGEGSAARFFYCAKASSQDRTEGLPGEKNIHPTVKPTELMRYLCRLVTPPGGVVLDPFMGSGSTGKGAMIEGLRFIGIEREAPYMEIARARVAFGRRAFLMPAATRRAARARPKPVTGQGDMFLEVQDGK